MPDARFLVQHQLSRTVINLPRDNLLESSVKMKKNVIILWDLLQFDNWILQDQPRKQRFSWQPKQSKQDKTKTNLH